MHSLHSLTRTPGDDNERLNEEYVVLKNGGDARLDLSGWQVADEGGHTYVVPQGDARARRTTHPLQRSWRR